jgi:hypothetical protein
MVRGARRIGGQRCPILEKGGADGSGRVQRQKSAQPRRVVWRAGRRPTSTADQLAGRCPPGRRRLGRDPTTGRRSDGRPVRSWALRANAACARCSRGGRPANLGAGEANGQPQRAACRRSAVRRDAADRQQGTRRPDAGLAQDEQEHSAAAGWESARGTHAEPARGFTVGAKPTTAGEVEVVAPPICDGELLDAELRARRGRCRDARSEDDESLRRISRSACPACPR